eukprot:jgi/Phyca11/105744/e_gw1.11.531.1
MLFVRRDTIPKLSTGSSSAVQYADASGWAAGGLTRKLVLSRSTSTLSSGLYYVGVHNSAYARGSLGFRLTVNVAKDCKTPTLVAAFNKILVKSKGEATNATAGGNDSVSVCLNSGECTCQCEAGWSGLSCNSPVGFELTQLWSAMENVSLLCSTCAVNFTLTRGQVLMFRVPEPLREGVGLRLTLEPLYQPSGGVTPSVYVSEVLPRSVYDFTYISVTNDSSKSQVVEVSKSSFSGDFWVVVHTDYLSTSSTSRITVAPATSARRRLGNDVSTFQLVAEQYERLDSDLESSLLTDQSFAHGVFTWVFRSTPGLAVFSFAVVLLTLALCLCVYRTACAPENRDNVLARLYPKHHGRRDLSTPRSAPRITSGAVVMDIQDPPGQATPNAHNTEDVG